MTANRQERLLTRILKLHRQAESARKLGSVEEADAFAAKAQQICDDHRLTIEDAVLKGDPDFTLTDDTVFRLAGRKQFQEWEAVLAAVVAEAHGCAILTGDKNGLWIRVIGRKEQAEVCRFMIGKLHKLAISLGQQVTGEFMRYYALGPNHGDTLRFRSSFLRGFVDQIMIRYRQRRAAVRSSGTALVVQDSHAAQRLAAKQAQGAVDPRDKLDPDNIHESAYHSGRYAAEAAPLDPNALGTPGRTSTLPQSSS